MDANLLPNTAMEMDKPPSVQMVKITNRNNFPMRDRFDGVPYTFLTNQPLSIPPQAAYHFFGWPGDREEMFRHTCMRWGWNRLGDPSKGELGHLARAGLAPDDDRTVAEVYFDNVKIETVNFDFVQRNPDGPIPGIPAADALPDETMMESGDLPSPQQKLGEPSGTHVGRAKSTRKPRKLDI